MKRSLAIWEQVLSPDDPRLAKELDNLAGFYIAQGGYAEAEPLIKRSLLIYKKTLYGDPSFEEYIIDSSITPLCCERWTGRMRLRK